MSDSTPYTDADIERDNREIIRLGKSLLRRHFANLAVERFADMKIIHDIVDECLEENTKLGNGEDGEWAQFVRSIQENANICTQ